MHSLFLWSSTWGPFWPAICTGNAQMTVGYHYNTANIHRQRQNIRLLTYTRHPITRLWRRVMGCLVWVFCRKCPVVYWYRAVSVPIWLEWPSHGSVMAPCGIPATMRRPRPPEWVSRAEAKIDHISTVLPINYICGSCEIIIRTHKKNHTPHIIYRSTNDPKHDKRVVCNSLSIDVNLESFVKWINIKEITPKVTGVMGNVGPPKWLSFHQCVQAGATHQEIDQIGRFLACHLGGHYRDYHPGALSLSQVTLTNLKIGHRRFHLNSDAETWRHGRVPGQ